MSYGITNQGFIRKTYEDILAELYVTARTPGYFGTDVDLSTASEVGQFVQLMAKTASDIWEDLEDVYYSNNVDQAVGVTLDRVVALGGFTRLPAQKSTVDVTASGVNGTTILSLTAGDTLYVQTPQGIRFESISSGIVAGGVVTVTARSIDAGEISLVPANSITQLTSPYAGINEVNNANASAGGEEIETDVSLRTRYKRRGVAGGSSLPALIENLLNVDNVTRATVIENASNTVDGEGRPPHSIECIVAGSATDTDIATAIFNSKPAGIEPVGTESKVVLDENGDSHTMKWSLPTEKVVNVKVTVTSNSEWDATQIVRIKTNVIEVVGGVDTIGSTVTEYSGLGIGEDVFSWAIESNFDGLVGVDDISVALAFAPTTPTSTRKLTLTASEYARCDTANVTVTVV